MRIFDSLFMENNSSYSSVYLSQFSKHIVRWLWWIFGSKTNLLQFCHEKPFTHARKNIDHFKKFFQCELNWTTLLHFQIFLCDLFFSLKKYYLFGKSLSAPWVFFPQTKQFLFNFKRDCKTTFCYSAEANANWIFVKDFEVQ